MRIEYIDNYLSEAEQLIYANQVDDAFMLMNDLLYAEPGYAQLHNHLGWAYLYYRQDVDKAEMHFQLAIKFNASYAAPYLHLGMLYIRKGLHFKAIEILERGLTLEEVNRTSFFEALAQAYELKKDFGKAIHLYKAALTHTVGAESNGIMEGIKRCRKKRITLFLSF